MRAKRWTIGAAALLVAGIAVPAIADARPQGAPAPGVTASAINGTAVTFPDCDGSEHVEPSNAQFTVSRGTAFSGTIEIDVTYGGTLVPGTDYAPLPDPVVIPAGETEVVLPIDTTATGSVTLTLEAGTGYVVGDPATATSNLGASDAAHHCLPLQQETISVGDQLPPFDVLDALDVFPSYFKGFTLFIEGTLPTGITFDNGFTGVAEVPGTYDYTMTWCVTPDGYCLVEAPFRVEVVTIDGSAPELPGPAPATPAAPVGSSPTYTG